jgi:hypothetical protein
MSATFHYSTKEKYVKAFERELSTKLFAGDKVFVCAKQNPRRTSTARARRSPIGRAVPLRGNRENASRFRAGRGQWRFCAGGGGGTLRRRGKTLAFFDAAPCGSKRGVLYNLAKAGGWGQKPPFGTISALAQVLRGWRWGHRRRAIEKLRFSIALACCFRTQPLTAKLRLTFQEKYVKIQL